MPNDSNFLKVVTINFLPVGWLNLDYYAFKSGACVFENSDSPLQAKMMSENNDVDQKTTRQSDDVAVPLTTTTPTGGNPPSNGNAVRDANNHNGKGVNNAEETATTPSTVAPTSTKTAEAIEALSTNNSLHNRSSATQSNWVQFDSEELPTDDATVSVLSLTE